MQTPQQLRSHEVRASSRWLPIYYGLFFAGTFLISLWAEVNRRKEQPTCSYVGVHATGAKATSAVVRYVQP